MTNHLTTPSGNLIGRPLIQRVLHAPGKGVLLFDGYGRMLDYIRVEDNMLGIQVRDLLNEFVLAGKKATQPDWSFLTPPAPVTSVAKGTKG